MAFITLQLPEDLDATTARVLRNILAQIDGVLSKEHNPDGSHGDISARSINVDPNPAIQTETAPIRLYGGDAANVVLTGTTSVARPVGRSTIVIAEATATPAINAIVPTAEVTNQEGESLLLINLSGVAVTLIFGNEHGFRLPDGVNYIMRPSEALQLQFIANFWMILGSDTNRQVQTGSVMMFFTACPTGYTELTSMRDFVPIGGTVAQAGNTLGNASVTPTFTGTPGTTGAGTAHSHGFSGTTDNESAHTHGVSGNTDNESAHTHGYGGNTDTQDVPTNSVEVQAGTGQLVNEVSGSGTHLHSYSGTSAAGSAHSHAVSFTSGAGSAHNHTFSGTSATESAHTHSFTPAGTISAVDVHQPSRRVVFCQKDP